MSWRVPSDYDLGYEDGQKPRFWNRWSGAGGDPTQSGIFLIDADSTTYNAPKVVNIANTFFTIDTAYPSPPTALAFTRRTRDTARTARRCAPTSYRHLMPPSAAMRNRPSTGAAMIYSNASSPTSAPTSNPMSALIFPANMRVSFAGGDASPPSMRRRSTAVRAAVDKAIRPFHSKALSVGLISLRTACPSAPSI